MNSLTTKATMTSTELMNILVNEDGQPKYEKKIINKKIRDMFSDKIDRETILPSINPNGTVAEYNLPETESIMFVAKNDIIYLEKISEFWKDKNHKPMSMSEIVAYNANQLVEIERKQTVIEQEQQNQSKQIESISKRQDQMDGDTKYMTILAYSRYKNIELPLKDAQKMGKLATKTCKQYNVTMGSIPDERWGSVKSYPLIVLNHLFKNYITK